MIYGDEPEPKNFTVTPIFKRSDDDDYQFLPLLLHSSSDTDNIIFKFGKTYRVGIYYYEKPTPSTTMESETSSSEEPEANTEEDITSTDNDPKVAAAGWALTWVIPLLIANCIA